MKYLNCLVVLSVCLFVLEVPWARDQLFGCYVCLFVLEVPWAKDQTLA